MTGGLPGEIPRFFQRRGGHSLLVKGASGTGKTMFALQLALELRDLFIPFYVSPRASRDTLLRQFPSTAPQVLRKETPRPRPSSYTSATCPSCGTPIDVATMERPIEARCSNCGEVHRFADRGELNRLIGVIEEGEKPVAVPLHLPEIETAYDVVDENLARYPQLRSLVLIDSIDVLEDEYDIRPWRLVNVLQKDLVENTGSGVVYVLGSIDRTKLDFLVDGLVSLSTVASANPRIRMLTIEKLRGCEVRRWQYLLTIRGGRLWEAEEDILDRLDRH